MPWATSVGNFFRGVGRTVRDTFDTNGDGRVGWGEAGLGALSLGTGYNAAGYGQRSIEAARRNFGGGALRQAAPAAGPPGYNYRGNEVDSGPNPYVRPPDVPIQPAGDYTPGGSTRRSGWANSGSRRTGGAFATPVGPGATSAERRSNMITGGYNGVGGLLSMGAGRAALGQSSLSMRNPTVQNQAR